MMRVIDETAIVSLATRQSVSQVKLVARKSNQVQVRVLDLDLDSASAHLIRNKSALVSLSRQLDEVSVGEGARIGHQSCHCMR